MSAQAGPPTTRQSAVLEFVRRYYADRGCGPTLRQIAAAVGLRGPQSAEYHVERLVAQGRLTRVDGAVRTLRPVGVDPRPVAAPVRVTLAGAGRLVAVYRFVCR